VELWADFVFAGMASMTFNDLERLTLREIVLLDRRIREIQEIQKEAQKAASPS
jgi:hypothetical protein